MLFRSPLSSSTCFAPCRSPQPSAAISLAAVATCVRQPLSEILQPAAAGRWRRARPRRLHARLLSCASLQRRLVVVLVVSFPWWAVPLLLRHRVRCRLPLRPAPQRIFKSPPRHVPCATSLSCRLSSPADALAARPVLRCLSPLLPCRPSARRCRCPSPPPRRRAAAHRHHRCGYSKIF